MVAFGASTAIERPPDGDRFTGFLAAVGDTLTATLAAGSDATQALTMIQQQ